MVNIVGCITHLNPVNHGAIAVHAPRLYARQIGLDLETPAKITYIDTRTLGQLMRNA